MVVVFLAQAVELAAFAPAQGFLLLPEQITVLRSAVAALDRQSILEV